jgi:hypothetical protein
MMSLMTEHIKLSDRLRAQARELMRIADQLDEAEQPEGRLVDTSVAEKIVGRSRSWLYERGAPLGLGYRQQSGSWMWFEEKLKLYKAGHYFLRDE